MAKRFKSGPWLNATKLKSVSEDHFKLIAEDFQIPL